MAKMKKDKRTINDLQNIHIKPVTRTPLKTEGDELRCFGRVGSSYSSSGTSYVKLTYLMESIDFNKAHMSILLLISWTNLLQFIFAMLLQDNFDVKRVIINRKSKKGR